MEIKLETTTAHLWFEELISGDQSITMDDVFKHLDQAEWYARAMLDGGVNQEGTFLSLEDEHIRQNIVTTLKGISDFRSIAIKRWRLRNQSRSGSEIDQQFDDVFDAFLHSADEAETALQQKTSQAMERFSLVQFGLMITALLLGSLAGIFFRQHTTALKEAKANVEALNNNLEAQVEQRTRQLFESMREAQAAYEVKSQFLSSMSHELRTPMNAIIGFAQLLELAELTDGDKECVKEILTGGHKLLYLIDQVLELNSIDGKAMSAASEQIAPKELVHAALQSVRSLAERMEVRLIDDTAGAAAAETRGDRKRLCQVLVNILDNAVKYNRPGGEARISLNAEEDVLRFIVSDTGDGMSADQIERVFLPFERLGQESGTIEGVGIGMTIAKAISDAIGGEISYQSEQGHGTTVTVTLPLNAALPPLNSVHP